MPRLKVVVFASWAGNYSATHSHLDEVFSIEHELSTLIVGHDDLGSSLVEACEHYRLGLPGIDKNGNGPNSVNGPVKYDVFWCVATDDGYLVAFLNTTVDQLLGDELNLDVDLLVGHAQAVMDDILFFCMGLFARAGQNALGQSAPRRRRNLRRPHYTT